MWPGTTMAQSWSPILFIGIAPSLGSVAQFVNSPVTIATSLCGAFKWNSIPSAMALDARTVNNTL